MITQVFNLLLPYFPVCEMGMVSIPSHPSAMMRNEYLKLLGCHENGWKLNIKLHEK